MRRPGRDCFTVCFILVHLLCAGALADAEAFLVHGQNEAPPNPPGPRPIFSSDTASPTLMKEGDYEQGLRILKTATKALQSDSPKVWQSGFTEIDRLLEHARWGCHPALGKWENLHLKADLLLAGLTPRQRESYLLGAEGAQAKAKAQLTSAQTEKNTEKLLRTVLRYANTESGLEGWSQYAWQLADRGELLLAEVQYQSLLDRYKLLGKQPPKEIWYQAAQVFALAGNKNKAKTAWDALRSAVGSAESVSIRGRTRLVDDLEKTIQSVLPRANDQRKLLLKDFAQKLRAQLSKQEEEHFETALLVNPEAIYGLVREAGAFSVNDAQDYVRRWINREELIQSDPCWMARKDRKLGTPTAADPKIQSLDLSYSRLTPEKYLELLSFPYLKEITTLEMDHLQSIQDRAGVFRAVIASPAFKNVTYLDLSNNYVGSEGVKTIASADLKNLNALDLANNNLDFREAKVIATTPSLRELSALYLGNNHLGAEGAKELAASAYLKNITQLGLQNNQLGTEGVKALASSPNLRKLSYLNLSSNYLDFEGVQALASSPYLTNLTLLNLDGVRIEDAGLRAILESPYLTHLVELNTREAFSPQLQSQLNDFLERNKKRAGKKGK